MRYSTMSKKRKERSKLYITAIEDGVVYFSDGSLCNDRALKDMINDPAWKEKAKVSVAKFFTGSFVDSWKAAEWKENK